MSKPDNCFVQSCISDLLNGLSLGLTQFSGPSRVAVIFAMDRTDELRICDPQHLLAGHEPAFQSLFLDNEKWRERPDIPRQPWRFAEIFSIENLELAGLISHGGYSGSVFFQHWFTDHHPDLCSTLPTERWLEHAVWRFSHDMANEQELYTGISGSFLKEYAEHAVRDTIIDLMNIHLGWDSTVRIYPVLAAVLAISKTREEGMWPEGELLFIDPCLLHQVNFLVRFNPEDQPQLRNAKHVRKLLLAVENAPRRLVSDGYAVIGISDAKLPSFSVCADFQGQRGFLKVNRQKICSFADGRFGSTTYMAKLVPLEERLLESDLDQNICYFLFKVTLALVHHARRQKHGCSIILDLSPRPVEIAGQRLTPPLDLRHSHMLRMAKSLTKVDGALHIAADQCLHGFACLMDGQRIDGEDMARGARYNSALRFTAQHPGVIVIVVSSDRPVSIIENGVDIQGYCPLPFGTSSIFPISDLRKWVNR
ncbi:MAG: DNA-binding protein [Desulfobulbus propionicus]|nr:MAG: DNA-binding protein [Desulfobulbus propionicus]